MSSSMKTTEKQKESNNNKSNIFKITICFIIVALIITVIIQNRQINTLKKNNQVTEVQNDTLNQKSSVVTEDKSQNQKENKKQGKVLVAESITANSNSKQDVSGEQLQKVEEQVDSTKGKNMLENITSMIHDNPVMEGLVRDQLKTNLSTTYETLAEELNLSPETKNSLIDLLVEKQLELIDMASQGGDMTREELEKETEWIQKTYDEKISKLLSPEEFNTYKEYAEVEPERTLINEFKKIDYVGDNQLDKEKEKELISAMYDVRQKMTEIEKMKQESGNLNQALSAEAINKGVELQSKLLDNYLESAGTVLSVSQMKNFSSFIDSRKSLLEMAAKLVGNSEQEQEEDK